MTLSFFLQGFQSLFIWFSLKGQTWWFQFFSVRTFLDPAIALIKNWFIIAFQLLFLPLLLFHFLLVLQNLLGSKLENVGFGQSIFANCSQEVFISIENAWFLKDLNCMKIYITSILGLTALLLSLCFFHLHPFLFFVLIFLAGLLVVFFFAAHNYLILKIIIRKSMRTTMSPSLGGLRNQLHPARADGG